VVYRESGDEARRGSVREKERKEGRREGRKEESAHNWDARKPKLFNQKLFQVNFTISPYR